VIGHTRLLARCPSCDRQHEFVADAQVRAMFKARRCKFCTHPAPPTLPTVPLDDDTARELSRAAKQVASWTERRNTLIRDAVAAGGGVREVARAVGLNHATVLNILSPKKRGGTRD
jgi:hypothetical protein